MYLYLGQDTVIKTGNIVGIFDLESSSVSRFTKQYLAASQKQNRVVEVTADLPKSFVVCQTGRESRVYLSQISPTTLKKRSFYIKSLANL